MPEAATSISVLLPSAEKCGACALALRDAVEGIDGVSFAELGARLSTISSTYDPSTVSENDLRAEIRGAGFELAEAVSHESYKVTGLDCPDCASTVAKSVGYLDGVISAELNFASGVLLVEFDPSADPRGEVVETLGKMGYGAESVAEARSRAVAEFALNGLACDECAGRIADGLERVAGVSGVRLSYEAPVVRIGYDPKRATVDMLSDALSRAGYVPALVSAGEARALAAPGWWSAHRREALTVAAVVSFVAAWVAGRLGADSFALAGYAGAIATGGALTARRAIASVKARSIDMNVLMGVAVLGAMGIGEWGEGAAVVVLFSIGNLLEARTLARTRESIRKLMQLAPQRARVRRDGRSVEISPSEAVVGDVLLIRAGERIALDGEVLSGASAVDESAVTGESVPVAKSEGDRVFAGTLNASGMLEVRVEALFKDSTLSRIIYLVEEAQAQRAPFQRLVDRFTRYYTPAVIVLAVAIAVLPPLVGSALGEPLGGFQEWFRRALVLLVVSCPCALVISTPVAVVSAITRATRDGVLIKGGAFLEAAPGISVVALDKTGTLTLGQPEVAEVVALNGRDGSSVLASAAALEAGSTHPIARAVVRAAGDGVEEREVRDFFETPGRGVSASLGGVAYSFGSVALAEESGVLTEAAAVEAERMERDGQTVLVLSADGSAEALIGVADTLRPESASVVSALRRAGIAHVVMLTGDNERTAQSVAARAGVSEFRARLLPEHKVDAIRELREEYGPVAMVGDGVNDAPALALADIGVAVGAAASDTALETADVALMAEGLSGLPPFFSLGRRTVVNIWQNVIVSIAVKLAVLSLAVFGVASLWMAVFADTGVALLVTLNGLRLLRARA